MAGKPEEGKSTFRIPGDTGWPERALEARERVDEHLTAMSGEEDLSVRAFHLNEAAKWASIYNMARSVLQTS